MNTLKLQTGNSTKHPQKAFNTGCYSIRTSEDPRENQVIYQNSTTMHLHNASGFLILAKNDFGKVKKRINLGIFNKKTNFIVGNKNSLLFWDTQKKQLTSPDISEVKINPSRYFMVYDMNFIGDGINASLHVQNKKTHEKLDVILNKQFGNDVGAFLARSDPRTTVIPEEFSILRSIIKIQDGKLSMNKQVLVNSNPDFLLGILEGYIQDSRVFHLKSNINIYNFTYILNLLGAQYSIRSVENNEKHIRFRLPIFLKSISSLNGLYFRSHKYFFDDELELVLKTDIQALMINNSSTSFTDLVNTGIIEMVPAKDLVFIEQEETPMYDLTMPDANATNYSLPGMPLAKNSDGDVLAIIGVMTKDAAQEATKKFSTELKENFLSLATGDVQNFGVKLDSAIGLFSATK